MEYNINHMTPVLFGTDTSKQTGQRLKMLGCKKVLFVYDQGIKNAGIADKVIASVKEAGINVAVYEGVQADPPDTTIDEGAIIGRREQVDGVVGVGGGSTMDTAKGINVMLNNPGEVAQFMQFKPGMAPPKPGKVLVLLPTTSGTGSEVTAVAVISDSKTHDKKGLGGPITRATLSIIDPLLTVGMPPSVTADTGMDAISHSIEAITATRSNPMSDILGEKAIIIAWKYLPMAIKDGKDIEARTEMSFAAMLAGFSFQDSMTQLGHQVGHTLGAMYHIPHGTACAVIQPEICEFMAEAIPDKMRMIGRTMGLNTGPETSPAETGKKVKDALRAFSKSIGQKSLKQLNVPVSDFPKIAEISAGPGMAMFCPRKVTKEDVLRMLNEAYNQ
jgi:alcohol dehydrogenase